MDYSGSIRSQRVLNFERVASSAFQKRLPRRFFENLRLSRLLIVAAAWVLSGADFAD